MSPVYVLLPPSETKSTGGSGPEFDPAWLSFPSLTPTRHRLLVALAQIRTGAAGVAATTGAAALIAPAGPTLPALQRYTGVLYAALDVSGMTKVEYVRAGGRVLVCSALFGLLAGLDPVPSYKFSAGSRLPGLPTVAALWRDPLTAVLAELDAPVLDLRSGAYVAFAPVPTAIAVRVVTVTKAGEHKPVSHTNKSIKGELARILATTRADVQDVAGLLRVARRAGLSVERTGPLSIDLIAPPAH